MDSSPPSRPRSLRPWYLVATLLLAWIVGTRGLLAGCGTAMFLRDGPVPDVTAVAEQARDQGDAFQFTFLVIEAAQARALSDHRNVAFPLAIARALLSGLLVIASGLALGGRRGSRGFALQVLVAGMAFAVLEYVLTREIRGAWIDMVARAGALAPPEASGQPSLTDPAVLWAAERMRLVVFELGALAVTVFALTRPRALAYFEAAARAAARSDES